MSVTAQKKDVGNGWRKSTLDQEVEIMIGGTPARKKKEYWDPEKKTDNVWVSIRDLSDLRGCIIADSSEYITDAGVSRSNVKLIKKGTPLMSFKLSIGKTAIAGKDLYTNEAIAAFVPKNNNLDVSFLYYILPTLAYDTDTAVKGRTLNKEKLKKATITLPSINEQKQISKILSSADEDILATQKVIDQTERVKKGLMRDLFTKGICHTKFKDSELGMIPESWEVKKLIELSNFIDYRGRTPKKTKSGIPLITAKNVRFGYLDIEPREYIAEEDYDGWMTRGIPNNGDVLFTTEAPLGNVAQITNNNKFALAQRIITIQGTLVSNNFLKYFLLSEKAQKIILSKGTGGTVKGIKSKVLKEVPVCLPEEEEQRKISNILNAIDLKIKTWQEKQTRLTIIKKGLMQDLLSGKTKVNV